MANDDKTIRDRVVPIAKYLDAQGRLDGYRFLNCQINGPAILFFLKDVRFQNNTFDGDFDAVLWEVPPTRQRVTGAVAVTDCVFDRCRLTNIGIAGPPELLKQFRTG